MQGRKQGNKQGKQAKITNRLEDNMNKELQKESTNDGKGQELQEFNGIQCREKEHRKKERKIAN